MNQASYKLLQKCVLENNLKFLIAPLVERIGYLLSNNPFLKLLTVYVQNQV